MFSILSHVISTDNFCNKKTKILTLFSTSWRVVHIYCVSRLQPCENNIFRPKKTKKWRTKKVQQNPSLLFCQKKCVHNIFVKRPSKKILNKTFVSQSFETFHNSRDGGGESSFFSPQKGMPGWHTSWKSHMYGGRGPDLDFGVMWRILGFLTTKWTFLSRTKLLLNENQFYEKSQFFSQDARNF